MVEAGPALGTGEPSALAKASNVGGSSFCSPASKRLALAAQGNGSINPNTPLLVSRSLASLGTVRIRRWHIHGLTRKPEGWCVPSGGGTRCSGPEYRFFLVAVVG